MSIRTYYERFGLGNTCRDLDFGRRVTHRESPWCAPGTLLIQCRLHKTKKHTVERLRPSRFLCTDDMHMRAHVCMRSVTCHNGRLAASWSLWSLWSLESVLSLPAALAVEHKANAGDRDLLASVTASSVFIPRPPPPPSTSSSPPPFLPLSP